MSPASPESAVNPPNILFLFPDQWRWDWLGCAGYGIPVRTPNIDAMAARGTRFTQCRSNSPLCAPARACLATGLRYHRTGVPGNGYEIDPDRHRTVFRMLRDAGYRVAATGKTDLIRHGRFRGLDGWVRDFGRMGFTDSWNQSGKRDAVSISRQSPQDPYMKRLHDVGLAATHIADYAGRLNASKRPELDTTVAPSPLPREHYTDDFCGQKALDLLNQWPHDPQGHAPWCLWVNFPGPHEPFDPPAELQRRYDGIDFPPPIAPQPESVVPSRFHQQFRRNYAAMIEGIDDWVGRLWEQVERRGEADRTLVVFASDHGEMLGDHAAWNKSLPFEASVHVPCVIAGPGVPAGHVDPRLMELIDLTALITESASLDIPPHWDARSPVTAPPRDVQHAALKDWHMLFDGRYKLVCHDNAEPELFDLDADPDELLDIAAEHTDRVADLRARLDAMEASPSKQADFPARHGRNQRRK